MGPVACLLPCGRRLHLQHGPIDLIIGADGARIQAFEAAKARFQTILEELVSELPALRTKVSTETLRPNGSVAQRMHTATMAMASDTFVTRMAAVAGGVADEVLAAMVKAANPNRAYVNNGGDIALHLGKGAAYSTAIQTHKGVTLGQIRICQRDPIRGIATSGRQGRSLSLGLADSVTVLAKTAARADVAATLIANAVDLPDHPGVTRCPARELDPDSDLGDLPVVTGCAPLDTDARRAALKRGLALANKFVSQGHINAAALYLQGDTMVTPTLNAITKDPAHV